MYRKIYNQQLIFLAVFCLFFSLYQHLLFDTYVQAALALAMGFICFIFNLFGAGDVKLLAILATIIPPDKFTYVLSFIAILGGVLAVLILLVDAVFSTKLKERGVPYGVPIVVAGLVGTYPGMS